MFTAHNPADSAARLRGGRTVQRRRRARSAAIDLLGDLPPLDSLGNAKIILDAVVRAGATGALPGVLVSSLVRGCEVFVKLDAHERDKGSLAEVRALVEKVEAEIAEARSGRWS